VLADAGAQVLIFRFQAGELEGVFHGDQQLLSGERLLKKVQCAEPCGADSHLDVGLAAHHHDRRRDAGGLQVFKQGEAVAAGHHYVAEDQVEGLSAGQFKGARRVVADDGFVPGEPEGAGERRQRVGFVVDDKDVCLVAYGVS
jgi:hypothetical protein